MVYTPRNADIAWTIHDQFKFYTDMYVAVWGGPNTTQTSSFISLFLTIHLTDGRHYPQLGAYSQI